MANQASSTDSTSLTPTVPASFHSSSSTSNAAATSSATPAPRLSYFPYPSLDHCASGLVAGLVSTLALHPFDLIKTRLQVRVGRNSFQAARALLKHEGAGALYKGLTPNLVGNTAAWGLYFFGYDAIKKIFSSHEPFAIVRLVSHPHHLPPVTPQCSHPRRPLNALEHILAASLTGTCVSALTNPLWVVKTRMFLDLSPQGVPIPANYHASTSPHPPRYHGLVDALRTIYRQEGFAGLYRGFIPGLFGVSHGAVQFMCYEELKKLRLKYRLTHAAASSSSSSSGSVSSNSLDTQNVTWSATETTAMSSISKTFASFATYPYQVIRSRMQGSTTHLTVRSVIKQTWRNEGIAGYYRGLWVNLVKVMPHACTVFVVYEQMNGYMKRHATYVQTS